MKNKNYITTTEAVAIANVTKMTIISWCKKYKIGKKVVGRWRINPTQLNRLLMDNGKENNKTNS